MVLAGLLEGVVVVKLYSAMYGRMVLTQDVSISRIQYDSRRVGPGDLFIAIRGVEADGHAFIETAVNRGARVVVVQDDAAMPDAFFMHTGVIKVLVEDTRKTLATMAANYYGHPSTKLSLIGVTGTNGKTTTTHLLKSMLEAAGRATGLLGTIEYRVGNEVIPATHTTPESLELTQLLDTMVQRGCSAAVMEVSSHALALGRVSAQHFSAAVFTNLTQDHLDYHGTMDAYFEAKRVLFRSLSSEAVAVSNAADPYGRRITEGTAARVLLYGAGVPADVTARDVSMSVRGLTMTISYGDRMIPVASALTGGFNVANILAAGAAAIGLGLEDRHIVEGVARLKAVRGRFEQISSPRGWTAIVDYAHTPDALEKCLSTIRELLPPGKGGKLITVFGCGGNRDAGKRPKMGKIASAWSDVTIVTSDNPRKEDPAAIIAEVMKGIETGKEARSIVDRRSAIRDALERAKPGDVVLVAGKGHENYQVVGETRLPFDDREEIEAYIREHA